MLIVGCFHMVMILCAALVAAVNTKGKPMNLRSLSQTLALRVYTYLFTSFMHSHPLGKWKQYVVFHLQEAIPFPFYFCFFLITFI